MVLFLVNKCRIIMCCINFKSSRFIPLVSDLPINELDKVDSRAEEFREEKLAACAHFVKKDIAEVSVR